MVLLSKCFGSRSGLIKGTICNFVSSPYWSGECLLFSRKGALWTVDSAGSVCYGAVDTYVLGHARYGVRFRGSVRN